MKIHSHVWKAEREEDLRTEQERDFAGRFLKYAYYAVFQVCVVCGKKRVEERRRVVL